MRIGILVDRVTVGGVGKVAIEEVKALNALDPNTKLVVLKRHSDIDSENLIASDLPIVYLDDRLPKFLRTSFKFPLFHFFSLFHITYPIFLPFVVKKNEFDYLIVHGTFTCFSAITLRYTKAIPFSAFIWDPIHYIITRVYAAKIPFVVRTILQHTAYLLDKLIVNHSDVVIVGGKAHNAYFKKISNKKKIKVIPPSVHPVKTINKNKADYILMVTAWKEGKSPEYIFELFKKIPQMKIKMVGKWLDGKYLSDFKSEIDKRNLNKNIEIVGGVNEKNLKKYYSEARFLLQTNDDRGFGMPALEAAGCGTSFIIPKDQGVCEIFQDKIHGYYTKERDTDEIVRYINIFLKNKSEAIRKGKAAWSLVVSECSWKKHAQELLQIAKTYSNT